MPTEHSKSLVRAGVALSEADKVLLMLHGRGATADDILSLADHLHVGQAHIIAPQATNHTWYPYGFMSPVQQNEPWLSSALRMLDEIYDELVTAGIQSRQVFLLGFSQGACLTLEFAARHARPYGGVVAFTGGLIGDVLNPENYGGDFQGTKVFIGNSDRDPHVPVKRSEESKTILEGLGADVTLKIYPGMAHTVVEEEIEWVNRNIFSA
jgi:phospholipase/carboxylesterase